ncbi:MAG TPA: ABC transporter permease [Candidatus Limnocylindrales bacterium]|nr:ABC transporter permease [Candidatus Limnocylindrales bacterium]
MAIPAELIPDPMPAVSGAARRDRLGVIFWLAAGWIGVIVVAATVAPLLPLADPSFQDFNALSLPPSTDHLLGTDDLGRDMLSRIVHGGRISLTVGLGTLLAGTAIGGGMGVLAGYFRGTLDAAVGIIVDATLAFPALVLALALTAFLGARLDVIVFVVTVIAIPGFSRIARAATISTAQREYITAARAMGMRDHRIILREIVPNVAPTVFAYGLVAVAVAIIVEGALSFLGVGLPPPTPSWGSLISSGRTSLQWAPWIGLTPSAALFLTVLSFSFAGERLRQRYLT